jgi:glycosyltransferase involved in cell wall biosynthesis
MRGEDVGLLAGQEDEAIADAICRLLKDRELRERLGSRARRVMVDTWDWRHRGPLLADLLGSVGRR